MPSDVAAMGAGP
jgi:hypothetical protein